MKSKTLTPNGPVTEQIKHGGEIASHGIEAILRKLGFQTFTRRQRIFFGAKVAAFTIAAVTIGPRIFGRFMRKSG